MPASSPLPPDLKFETALAELESLVDSMENDKLELEASIAAWQRGMALLQHCQAQLAVAEQKIQGLDVLTAPESEPEPRV
ncbi:MAG: exodeoxyribonuclease VII small subunit [Zoogloeaceae bacterium]|jgi:exodeoxyribonuclease VII small subunit|nr:exodeoxyribonuclease VII small subunit [Zoogloeaceae bacterium]